MCVCLWQQDPRIIQQFKRLEDMTIESRGRSLTDANSSSHLLRQKSTDHRLPCPVDQQPLLRRGKKIITLLLLYWFVLLFCLCELGKPWDLRRDSFLSYTVHWGCQNITINNISFQYLTWQDNQILWSRKFGIKRILSKKGQEVCFEW